MNDYPAVAEAIRAAGDIALTAHINPDADGIGTGLALAIALRRMGKRVRFLSPSPMASIYAFLPGFADGRVVETPEAAAAEPRCDLLIACDCGDRKRLGEVAKVACGTLVNLDHHATNERFGDLNLVDERATCSGMVAARLLAALGAPIDREIAGCLYATLVFDTGRFMHSNTNAEAFRFAAELLDTGIDAAAINRRLTYTRTPKDYAILRLALDHLAVDPSEPRLAGIVLTRSAIDAVGEPEDWGDLVDIPRALAGVEVAYLLREGKPGKDGRPNVRMSLRSNPPYAVAPVAQAHGGGGHQQAAGATFEGTLDQCLAAVIPLLRTAARGS